MARLLLLAWGVLGALLAVLVAASPASAVVTCADLGTQSAGQSYYDGHPAERPGLDADGDGVACEASVSGRSASWSMVGLGAVMAAGVVGLTAREGRSARRRGDRRSASGQPIGVRTPADGLLAPAGHKEQLLSAGRTGSLADLARALRVVPYAERMALLEQHAAAHAVPPHEVLADLVDEVRELELQGWALTGYDAPATVRLLHCACVRGLRNYKLHVDAEGTSSWECATCHKSVSAPA